MKIREMRNSKLDAVRRQLIHQKQEQDAEDFKGYKQDYNFSDISVYMTTGFVNAFGPLCRYLVEVGLDMINQLETEKERVQVFYYGDRKFWVESNWPVGTEKEDYLNPEELGIVFLLPSEH